MSTNETLRIISVFPAKTGIHFDLLADSELKHFYIKLQQLWKSVCNLVGDSVHYDQEPSDIFKAQFERTFTAPINTCYGKISLEEVISVEDVKKAIPGNMAIQMSAKKFFPFEIFDAILTPFPKPVTKIDNPTLIFSTNEEKFDERINIFRANDRNLISLAQLNYLSVHSYQDFLPLFVKVACQQEIFLSPSGSYFIDLRDVTHFPCVLPNFENLQKRFQIQVFMTAEPYGSRFLDLNCKFFKAVNTNAGEFVIYQGDGFAENSFFFSIDALADLLDANPNDDADEAFEDTVFVSGYFFDNAGGRFYRLDKAAYIPRHYLARLWNGENETNDRIKKGWAFIRWFNAFLPTFFKDNVKYWCGGQYPNYNFEEPTQYAPITHDERNFIADFLAKSRTALNNLAETLNLEAE